MPKKPLINIESPRRKLRGFFDRKEVCYFLIRSLTPPQAAGLALAFAVQFSILAFVSLLLYGCVQTQHNTSTLQNENSVFTETNAVVSAKTVPKENYIDQKSENLEADKTDAAKINTIKVSTGNDTENQAVKADENLSAQKKIQSVLDEALDFCQVSQDFWQKGELENAVEALDKAYSLILDVDTNDDSELVQQKEDLRFMISKRILEIYASRNIVVNGNHNAIPMVMNKHIQAEIILFTKGNEKNFFIESYKRSGMYRSYMVEALKEAGLPVELSWLPLIESGFKVGALSKARALGLWQFIPSTGYKFGLNRDIFIDERMDPFKATKAAIAYLKELHSIFGDWATVLAAYNCGEGKVLRVIRSQNVNYLDNFWDLYERLPRETARYVPRFLAVLHILKDMEKNGFDPTPVDIPLEYETITVTKQVHLKDIAEKIGSSEKTLKQLNPELRYNILPGNEYPLKVPRGKGSVLLASLDNIPVSSPPRPAYVKHKVRTGETLSTIARKYRTSMSKIAEANNIHKQNYIVAGTILKVPQKGTFVPKPERYNKSEYGLATTHVVKSGDSLWILARRYSTTTQKIQETNKLSSTNLHIGQALKIPGHDIENTSGKSLGIYMVKRGDSSFSIARLNNMSLEHFLRINRLTPRSKIYPGQKLYIE
ncbi:MAG: LysM peptidoglycan-binding domain-containing protein [Candidatus Desulfaltia sp.]|nr:LysM peptidoglycan-binding domain-containing protein [Candidatus Desulfaltia sp.]